MSKAVGIVDADGSHWRFSSEFYDTYMSGEFPENCDDADLDYFLLSVSHDGDLWFFKLFLHSCPKGMLIDLVIDVQMTDITTGQIHVDQRWQVNNLSAKWSRVNLYPPESSTIDKNVRKWRKSVTISSVTRTSDGGFGKVKPSSHIISVKTKRRVPWLLDESDTCAGLTYLVENETNGQKTASQTDVVIIEDSSRDEDFSNEEVSSGLDNYSSPQLIPPSRNFVATDVEGKTAESSTQTDCSPNTSGAAASTSSATEHITSNDNGIDQNAVDSNEIQTELPPLSFETLRLVRTLAETQLELASTQAQLKTSQLVAENLRLQLKCDRLEAQCKTLAEQLATERKSNQITVESYQQENDKLNDRIAQLEVKLIELQNHFQQQQKQQPNDLNSVGNRDQQKLKNRLTNRYIEENSKEEGNAQSSTVSSPPESSQPTADGQQIGQSASYDVVGMET